MALFNFLKKGINKELIIYAPIEGKVVDISTVPDPAFAEKMIGDGCAIIPKEGSSFICSPVSGRIDSIFDTNHAITFETPEGLEIIVHFGVDTVRLNGEYFKRLREDGEVNLSDKIISYELSNIEKNVPSVLTPVIICNMDSVISLEVLSLNEDVKIGDPILKVKIK